MPRARITRTLRINVNGYDRVATVFEPGEQDVPESVAAWLAHNPEYGKVLGDRGQGAGIAYHADMTKAELLEIAQARGLDVRQRDTKAEIYNRLVEQDS
jgi:hypothetical protein